MFIIAEWLAGFVIAITQVTETLSAAVIGCAEKNTTEGRLFIDCAYAGIEELPQQFNAILEILNISYTGIESFRENDFKMYSQLKVLDMKGLTITKAGMPAQLLTPLTKLEYLDISGMQGDYIMPKFPSSIRYLLVNEIEREEQLDLTALINLKELYMAQTPSKNFPKLNKMAPLTSIAFEYSIALDNLHYDNVSSFCLLRIFKIDHHTRLTQPEHQAQCCGILGWMEKFKIVGLHKEFHCYNICNDEAKQITSEALDERHDCLVRNGLAMRKLWRNMLIGVVALIALSFLAYLAYRAYGRYFSSNLAMDKFVEKEKMEEEEEEEAIVDEG